MESTGSTNKDTDQDIDEKELVTKKVRLENGTFGFVFSRNVDEVHKPYWRCNICDVVVGGSLSKHALGRKHQSGMAIESHPVYLFNKASAKPMLDLKLAPGEPVPPGFEDEVRGITEIQASLDAYHSGPLIGLEYLIELSAYEDEREPQYVCLLCDKRGDPRTVMSHLISFNHRMTYLMTHFPTAYRALNPYTKQYRRNVQNIVSNICEHIEKRYGRMVPQVADRESFERKKPMYLESVLKDNHPSERLGETFEHLVDKEVIMAGPKDPLMEIKKANEEQFKGRQYRKTGSVPGSEAKSFKRDPSPPVVAAPGKLIYTVKGKTAQKQDRRSLSSISSISSSSLSSPHSRSRSRSHSRSRSRSRGPRGRYSRRRYPDNLRRTRSRTRSPQRRYHRRSRSYSRSPPPRYKRDMYSSTTYYSHASAPRLPWQRPDYGRSRAHYLDRRSENMKSDVAKDRIEEYKKQAMEIEEEMAKILEQHERNPEKHPLYPDEWKKFWNRRYKELQSENKDPTKHDFKPEWIDFWNKRMKEMHDAELKAKKDALRKRMNLPEEPAPISFRIMNRKKMGAKEDECNSASDNLNVEPDIIVIDDSKEDDSRDRKRSHSPWEPEPSRDRARDRYISDYSRDYYKSKLYREPPRDLDRDYKRKQALSPQYSQKDDGEINVVAILRLLTAVEEKLGSLGPRIIELLSQALALEKTEANSAETILDNEVNCVLFETVKEKLKGQLLAGMVEHIAEKTFKNAIQKIASLLHFASERKKSKEKENQNNVEQPVKIPGIGSIDKGAIARQIATALVAQGKTDVTQGELEQLINAVVGMAQASQMSGKTVSTATFAQQVSNSSRSDIASILQNSLSAAKKANPMFNALQLLQSTTALTESLTSGLSTTGPMDSLSDSELKTLLQNFKDLSTDEQHSLITYLKKLEAKEPDRVERLRKFVKLGPPALTNIESEKAYTSTGKISPFSIRESGCNPSVEELNKSSVSPAPTAAAVVPIVTIKAPPSEKLKIDSDEDEDYSYEDVFRAASKNVSEKQLEEKRLEETKKMSEKPKDIGVNLTDAKALIANLVSQLAKKNNSGLNLLGLGTNMYQSAMKLVDTSNNSATTPINFAALQSVLPALNQITNLANTNVTTTQQQHVFPQQGGSSNSKVTAQSNQPFTTSAVSTQSAQSYGFSSQPNARSYHTNYNNTYTQSNVHGNQTLTTSSNYNKSQTIEASSEYNMYNSADYVNSYGQTLATTRQPGYNRIGQQQQAQYPQFDPRQNYYH